MAKIKHINRLCLLTLMTLIGLYGRQSLAACNASTPLTINLGNIIVPSDVQLATPLTSFILIDNKTYYDCEYSISSSPPIYGGIKALTAKAPNQIADNNVFNTNLSGVGFTLGSEGMWLGKPGIENFGGDTWLYSVKSTFKGRQYVLVSVQIQLFKTGNMKAGVLSGQVGSVIGKDQSSTYAEIPIYITGTLTKIGCTLNSTNINVPLGDVLNSRFTGVGSTTGDKSFDLGLSCDKDAKINLSLAGSQNADTSETSVLALTNAGQQGTASGVGVQLLYGGTPLKLNNNLLLRTSAGGQETLAFSARYYQTKSAVGVGTANSSATLNITYQ